ncbi:MAG: SHOCT domain-containing protein, partial [Bacteroidetes bacterium]|nr:SHOCT domain-containing protein [Bacteroidota bacterium]
PLQGRPFFGFSQRSETSILFEDISSLTRINNSIPMAFISVGILLIAFGIYIVATKSSEQRIPFSLMFGVLGAILFFIGLSQPNEYLQIETRGGNKIGALFSGDCSQLIDEIESLRRSNHNNTVKSNDNNISIEKAKELYDKGLITQDEFDKVKCKVLGI